MSSNGFYTNFFSRGSRLYVRHYKDGIQCESVFDINPVLYITSDQNKVPSVNAKPGKNIAGEVVYPIEFDSPRSAKDFLKSYADSSMKIYGYPRFDYATIDELFPGEIEPDYSLLRTMIIDIETEVESGFPNLFTANERINLVSVLMFGEIYSFGLHAVDHVDDDVTYTHCPTEEDLLLKMLSCINKLRPDIITGWNSNGFDIPYIYNRICVLFGEEKAKKLSPTGMIKKTVTSHKGRDGVAIEISGLQTIDYLELYQKFELEPRENYKLDTIGLLEVGEAKVEYDCTFKEFSSVKNWNKFAKYNWQDVRLVAKIDAKKQFIRIAFNMAISAKCNIGDVYRVTRIWDNIIANHLREQNIHVAATFHHTGVGYEGAFVKPTTPGLYKWCASFDFASLYPKNIEMFNISPDTILPCHLFPELTAQDVIEKSDKYHAAIKVARANNATLCANGSMYSREKQGFLPALVVKYFNKRVTAKTQMKTWGREAEEIKAIISAGSTSTKTKLGKDVGSMSVSDLKAYLVHCETMASQFDSVQHSTKIMLNSMYGALGTPYFRMYDVFQAEGITLSGQCAVTTSYEVMNDFMNGILKTKSDYVVASDTDSAYVNFTPLMDVLCEGVDERKHVDVLQKITDGVLAKKLTAKFDQFAIDLNAMSNCMDMKREAIASACFVAKKNYVMNVYDNEGTRYASPKQKITGLEAIKSGTPKFFQEKLTKGYEFVFNGTNSTVKSFISAVYDEYMSLPIERIAATSSVTELAKYIDGDGFVSGAPFNVKAAVTYNRQLIKLGLGTKYVPIAAGDKIKIINLKIPNPLHQSYFAYLDKFPYEVIDQKYIDREKNYEKYFINPIKRVLDVVGWSHEDVASLEDFF